MSGGGGRGILETIQKLLEFQMNLLVVEEEVADELNQLGAGQRDHGLLTSPELRTTSCDLHELGRNWIPTCGGEESLSYRLLASL
ncbi:hypothetical protein Tco_1501497 [Tanacetum coccineum]